MTWIWESLSIIAVMAAFFGVVLNARKNAIGFMIWIPTNLFWIIHDLIHNAQPARAFMHFLYFVMAIYGLMFWKKKIRSSTKDTKEHKETPLMKEKGKWTSL